MEKDGRNSKAQMLEKAQGRALGKCEFPGGLFVFFYLLK